MEEKQENAVNPEAEAIDQIVNSNLPLDTADTFWGKIKSFFLQEVEEDNFWFKSIALEPAVNENGEEKSFLFRKIILQ